MSLKTQRCRDLPKSCRLVSVLGGDYRRRRWEFDNSGTVVWSVGDLLVASRTIVVRILAPAEETWEAGANTGEHAAYNPC